MEKTQWKPDVKIVLGSLFGDEGKGNTVQWLCKQAITEGKKPLVIRFSGGAQAGHRVVHNGISHICSSYGSGVLLRVPTLWINPHNTFIDPCAIELERQTLIKETGNDPGYPYISTSSCRFVHPFDILSNKSDKKTLSDGSCGMGIYACFKRYNEGWTMDTDPNLYYDDFLNDNTIDLVVEYEADYEALIKWNSSHPIRFTDYDTLIFEGSQGLLLDMDCGFMPNCTPSHTGLNGIPKRFITEDTEVYLVSRTYLTRHGNGYEPKNWYDDIVNKYINIPKELSNSDTGTQGKFKTGILELSLLNRAIDRHHLDNYPCKFNWVITHVDCLKDGNTIPVFAHENVEVMDVDKMSHHLRLPINKVILFDKEEMQ